MENSVKNLAVTVLFIVITFGFMVWNMLIPDTEISNSERRRLAKMPELSFMELFSGDFFSRFEKYSLDQFVLRDDFRGLKAFTKFNLLKQKDNNGIYISDGFISKLEYPLNEKSVLNAADKINEIYSKYLQNMNVNYAIIPDKNFFMASENEYLSIDYGRMAELMNSNITDFRYIDLYEALSLDDYYRTDIHWSQNKLVSAADRLLSEMGNDNMASDTEYIEKELNPFYGSYYGQAALGMDPDTLVYMTNDTLERAVVYDHYSKSYSSIYEPERFSGVDPYDVFLSGPKPLLTVENPDNSANKGLILFRDSFGSSIAPLLLTGYSKITLVDLRLISTDILGEYIDFSEYQDALFLYCTPTLNNSYMFK